mgnify:CR=1 FL=1
MKTLNDQLSQYAAYHRDRRNIVTHFVGIPMIVLAVVVLLARPAFEVAGLSLSAATLAVMAATLYYLRLDLRFGVVMGLLLAAWMLAGLPAAAGSAPQLLWITGDVTPLARTRLVERLAVQAGLQLQVIDYPLRGPASLGAAERVRLGQALDQAGIGPQVGQ